MVLSLEIHDQSYNDWMCWAYSVATMLRVSVKLLLQQSLSVSLIDKQLHDSLVAILDSPNHHKTLRSEIVMVVFPMRMNQFPKSDLVSISLVVDRVSILCLVFYLFEFEITFIHTFVNLFLNRIYFS